MTEKELLDRLAKTAYNLAFMVRDHQGIEEDDLLEMHALLRECRVRWQDKEHVPKRAVHILWPIAFTMFCNASGYQKDVKAEIEAESLKINEMVEEIFHCEEPA